MDWQQVSALAQVVFLAISFAMMVGVWRGRREAAENAAAAAISHVSQLYEEKLTRLGDQQVWSVDSIKAQAQLLTRLQDTQAAEFSRLHTKANDTQRLLHEYTTDLGGQYVLRREFDTVCKTIDRRLDHLEDDSA
jgi:hypothetical protein